eukprot:gene53782-27694_t
MEVFLAHGMCLIFSENGEPVAVVKRGGLIGIEGLLGGLDSPLEEEPRRRAASVRAL